MQTPPKIGSCQLAFPGGTLTDMDSIATLNARHVCPTRPEVAARPDRVAGPRLAEGGKSPAMWLGVLGGYSLPSAKGHTASGVAESSLSP